MPYFKELGFKVGPITLVKAIRFQLRSKTMFLQGLKTFIYEGRATQVGKLSVSPIHATFLAFRELNLIVSLNW